MKKIVATLAVAATLLFTTQQAQAQAWDKSSKVILLGFGASNFFHIYNGGTYNPYTGYRSPLTGQLNFQMEFGIHKYVGLGFTTGVGGRAGYSWGRFASYAGEVNAPIGMIANFHFYQLIADKVSSNIHADKLDIYGGVSVGSGIAALFYNNGTDIVPIAFGGPHVGIRYYFSEHVGVNAEVGFGKSLVNGGFAFRL